MAHWRRTPSRTVPAQDRLMLYRGGFLVALAGLVSGAWLWSARKQPGIDRDTAARLNPHATKDGTQ
ncbi:hypothetical protein [Blastomonas sp. UPD001]|uniref:hypothetical protein n=1 Tax=Blastomonas sp. UPD001 TaxID=2217673 RepID=UPI0013001839|nr:hypothetical protein [Blastomonas sp. UPD001]MBL0965444.1 hypothetical protein [Blastomonas sp.]